MKYRIIIITYPSRGELVEVPDRDEILDEDGYRAFLDFMVDQGFKLVREDKIIGDQLAEMTLIYELLGMADEETKGVA